MPSTRQTAGTREGVYYAPGDYAGFLKRFVIIIIDFAVLVAAYVLLAELDVALRSDHGMLPVDLIWLIFALGYLVVLEPWTGTVGFLVTGVKIVNLSGERPSVFRVGFRLSLWVLGGPFHPLFDLIFLSGDERKQTVRDKLAGTYVVNKDAMPEGKGPIKWVRFMLLAMNLLVPEVQKPKAS